MQHSADREVKTPKRLSAPLHQRMVAEMVPQQTGWHRRNTLWKFWRTGLKHLTKLWLVVLGLATVGIMLS